MLEDRKAILIDDSPLATNMEYNLINYVDMDLLDTEYKKLIQKLEDIINGIYYTKTSDGRDGYADVIIASNVYKCPNCKNEIVLYKSETGKRSEYKCKCCSQIINIASKGIKELQIDKRRPVEVTIIPFDKSKGTKKEIRDITPEDIEKENPNTKPLNFAKEYNKRFEINKNLIAVLNDYGDEEKTKTHLTTESIRFNSDNEKYELDEYGLMQSIFKKYINFFLQTEIYLKLFLEQHQTFNTNLISIADYNGLDIIKTTELKEEKKKIKENIKQHEKEFYDEINSLDLENEILKMILNYEEIEQQDIWKIKNYEYLCNEWKDEYLEEYRKRYKQVSEILKDLKTSEIDKLKIALNKKEISGLIKQINYINYNLLYNKDKELRAVNKDMQIVYKIRGNIIKAKGKERSIYLSNKFKTELLQELQKEKSLSELSLKNLDKHLKLIYNISNNKKDDIISSLKIKL